jgi:site-specific DNA-methyltransferase (adenine-specific)
MKKNLTREERERIALKNPLVAERMAKEGWTSARYTLMKINKELKDKRLSGSYQVNHKDVQIFQANILFGLPMIADKSVNAIVTDPPYNSRSNKKLFTALGGLAKRVLTDDGILVCMVGTNTMPYVASILSEHLRFWWQIIVVNKRGGSPHLQHKKVSSQYKSVLLFVKQDKQYTGEYFEDIIKAPPPDPADKMFHPHGQPLKVFTTLIDTFTKSGETVLDPFSGGGTTAMACIHTAKKHRKIITCDIDPVAVQTTKERVLERLEWCDNALDLGDVCTNNLRCHKCRKIPKPVLCPVCKRYNTVKPQGLDYFVCLNCQRVRINDDGTHFQYSPGAYKRKLPSKIST